MSERATYEPGVPCWVDTLSPDPDAAMRFYGGIFGWEFAGPGRTPGDPPGRYFVAHLRGKEVAGVGSPAAHGSPPVWNTYIAVARLEESVKRASKRPRLRRLKPESLVERTSTIAVAISPGASCAMVFTLLRSS